MLWKSHATIIQSFEIIREYKNSPRKQQRTMVTIGNDKETYAKYIKTYEHHATNTDNHKEIIRQHWKLMENIGRPFEVITQP